LAEGHGGGARAGGAVLSGLLGSLAPPLATNQQTERARNGITNVALLYFPNPWGGAKCC
jgi:hypothetical protein